MIIIIAWKSINKDVQTYGSSKKLHLSCKPYSKVKLKPLTTFYFFILPDSHNYLGQSSAQNPTPAAPTPSVAGRCGSSFLFFQKQGSGINLAEDLIGSDLQRVNTNGSYPFAPTSFCSIIVAIDTPAPGAATAAGNEHEERGGCSSKWCGAAVCVGGAGFLELSSVAVLLTLFLGSFPSPPLVFLMGLSGSHRMKSVLQTQVSLDTSMESFGSHIIRSKQSSNTKLSLSLSGFRCWLSRNFDSSIPGSFSWVFVSSSSSSSWGSNLSWVTVSSSSQGVPDSDSSSSSSSAKASTFASSSACASDSCSECMGLWFIGGFGHCDCP